MAIVGGWAPPAFPPLSSLAPGSYGDGVNRRGQIQMSPEETRAFLDEARNMTMCTFDHDGTIHAVAMWYGFVDGTIAIQTKSKSQKARNLRRDPRATCLVEAGEAYNELRGVEMVGWAELVEDPDELFEIGASVFGRHIAPYTEELRPQVEVMLRNRVGAKLHVERTVTWDHRKLGG